MKATERLFLTNDKTRVVSEDDPEANFLFAIPGDDITPADVQRYGIEQKAEKANKAEKAENKADDKAERVADKAATKADQPEDDEEEPKAEKPAEKTEEKAEAPAGKKAVDSPPENKAQGTAGTKN